ncbi:MAG: peptidase T [Solobacterium sp.]|nr:peptidase T [Solobacterium sp.]
MSIEERLIRYCKIDTQSDPSNEEVTPSSNKQFDLANLLVEELKELDLQDVEVDEHCYVYAKLPTNIEGCSKKIGFIAHMDTAPDFSGKNVQPRIIENFDGKDIVLNEELTLKMDSFPWMKEFKGKRIMVSDGTTLLGADDKAGIAAIMEALVYLCAHPEVKRPNLSIAFTPDEEIGNGAKYFDIKKFDAEFAYTMDGSTVREMSDETFNAASAKVSFQGFSIHPGEAKDKMVNAALVASAFAQSLPAHMTPEHTEGREGFIHLHNIKGDVEKAELEYILRDHDLNKLEEKKVLLEKTVEYFNHLYGKDRVKIEIKDSYHNMKEVLLEKPEAVNVACCALKELGIEILNEPVRGGTDGSQISFMGIPCPNLGTGGGNFHGPYEYCVIDELEMARDVILKIAEIVVR